MKQQKDNHIKTATTGPRRAEATAEISADLQAKMEERAAAVLADIFRTMPKDPTIDELDAELRTATILLKNVEARHNCQRPKGAPRMKLSPTGMLLQALTERYYKDDAGVASPHRRSR